MTWSVIKEAIGKNSSRRQNFTNKINLGSKFTTSTDSIAKNFNIYFTGIGPNLANKISAPLANFDKYLNNMCNIFQLETILSIIELKDVYYSLKTNKSAGCDDISFNIIKQFLGTLNRHLHYIYNICLQQGDFPEETKIAWVTPIFKGGEVSVLCGFSQILEKIMYNRLYRHLLNDYILYKKQFGFQENHSIDHAIIQPVDQISNNFEKTNFTLDVFIHLSKAFDTGDHVVLIKKLDITV